MILGPTTKWLAIALVIVVVAPIIMFAILSLTARRPSTLGLLSGNLRPCPNKPNCVCSAVPSVDHAIEPLVWKGLPQSGLERLIQVIGQFPRTKCEPIKDGRYLHAEFTSAMFRFVDDVEFLADPEAGVIHVRSASRAGHSDLGVNRQRVEAIREKFAAMK